MKKQKSTLVKKRELVYQKIKVGHQEFFVDKNSVYPYFITQKHQNRIYYKVQSVLKSSNHVFMSK